MLNIAEIVVRTKFHISATLDLTTFLPLLLLSLKTSCFSPIFLVFVAMHVISAS